MSGKMGRRLAAVEAAHGIGCAQRLLVKHRPDGLDAADRAAWEACDNDAKADQVVVIRQFFAPWPPRTAADADSYVTTRLCADRPELMRRVLAMSPYPEQGAVIAGLHVT